MKASLALIVVALLGADAAAGPIEGSIPWLHDFVPAVSSERASLDVVARMEQWQPADPSCSASAYGGLAVDADVAPSPGIETVLASYTQGILVLDRAQHLVASAPPLVCSGSADEIEMLAVGEAWIGAPVIALVVTEGGHREYATWIVLMRVQGTRLEPVFAAIVEQSTGSSLQVGDVTVLPGALVYRTPGGDTSLWSYDLELRRYVVFATKGPEA